jgi:hypothetical protein
MPEDHGERAGYGEHDDFDEPDEFDDLDDFADLDDDEDEPEPGRAWPAPGYPPGAPGDPPGGWHRGGGSGARRGWLLALTAVVAAAAGFGVVAVAFPGATGRPPAAGATPSSSAAAAGGSGAAPSSGAGNGTRLAPRGGGPQSLPPGATERLEIGGQVTAVSAASITLDGGGQPITATVTRATTITGKVTSIAGIRVGDFVSASITGANGKLTADSIQDPASLPTGSGQ